MKPMSMNQFATLWDVECEFHRHGRNCITTFEKLNTTAPKDARPSCSSFSITFYDKTGNEELEKVNNHRMNPSASPSLWFVDGTWWEMCGGEVRYLDGAWFIVREGWKHSRVAKMMNRGFPHYRK